MGIKERYDALRASQTRTTEIRVNEESERREDELSRREAIEWIGEWRKHLVLLKELHTLGVARILEEFTGERMKFLASEDGIERVAFDRPWEEEFIEAVGTDKETEVRDRDVWTLETVSPYLSEYGFWNSDVRLHLRNVDMQAYPYGSNDSASVVLSYSPDRTFAVRGQETVFRGRLPEDQVQRTTLVENAVASAIINPIPRLELLNVLYPN